MQINDEMSQNIQNKELNDIQVLDQYQIEVNKRITISIVQNDITQETTDVITNAANSQLQHCGGLAGAIRLKAGVQLELESRNYVKSNGPLQVGKCCVTNAGNLPSQFVIHAVGPVYQSYSREKSHELLQNCIINTLELAKKLQINSISIPAISSGIFGFPKQECAKVIYNSCIQWSSQDQKSTGSIKTIRLCNFDEQTCQCFQNEFKQKFQCIN